jgi:hypothetical protein
MARKVVTPAMNSWRILLLCSLSPKNRSMASRALSAPDPGGRGNRLFFLTHPADFKGIAGQGHEFVAIEAASSTSACRFSFM